jgi:hypothetical protein
MSRNGKYLLIFILTVVVLTPLGLIAEGPAWGEWSPEEIKAMLGYVPESIATTKPLMATLIPDYEIRGLGSLASTWVSAIIGVGLVFVVMMGIKKSVKRAS